MKQKVTFTVDSEIFKRAKAFALKEKRSLSSIVELSLKRIVLSAKNHSLDALEPQDKASDWLDAFHKRHLDPKFKGPSDEEVLQMRTKGARSYR